MNQINIRKLPSFNYDMEESMNVLRTNIAYSSANKKVILVTSCAEDEGKTTIAMQMATNIAQAGQKVLLLDADLRKSVIYGRYGISSVDGRPILGLADLLSGSARPEDIIYKTPIENLSMSLIGHFVLNPTPLFEGELFANFLQQLRSSFDCVILDSPPLERVIDAAVIAPLCDGVVIVVASGETTYESLNRVKKQLLVVNAKILGCVLNKAEHGNERYYRKKYDSYYGGSKT